MAETISALKKSNNYSRNQEETGDHLKGTTMVLHFRCFNCWKQLGFKGNRDYIICPDCNARLFVGPSKEVSKTSLAEEAEHTNQLQKLHNLLSKNNDIYRGVPETIAGEITRHVPDAVYYNRNDTCMRQPIIYQIIIPSCPIITEDIVSKCQLFSETARNLFSVFYLAVSARCGEKESAELVQQMCLTHKIEGVTLLVL
jgi:DNA-directed RNA polymerase subunit RPC12/RpoP